MKRYTFQALVTLDQPAAAGHAVLPPDQTRRMAVKCRHHQTGRITFFSALVTSSGPAAAEWKDDNVIVTIKSPAMTRSTTSAPAAPLPCG